MAAPLEAARAARHADLSRGPAPDRRCRSQPLVRPDRDAGRDDDADDAPTRAGRCSPAPSSGRHRARRARPLPQRRQRRDPVGGTSAPSHSPAARPPRCAALSIAPPEANPKTMLIRIRTPICDTMPRLCAIDRVVDAPGGQQDPEHPEHGPRRSDRRDIAAEDEARGRAGGRTGEIERAEAQRAVPALDDRTGEVQRVHVEREMEDVPVEQRDAPQPPVLALRDGRACRVGAGRTAPGRRSRTAPSMR